MTPAYQFHDTEDSRRPFETYVITFDEVTADAVRLIGQPGGPAQFTSLARLAVYHRDLSRWNPTSLSAPPTPYVFRLIPAAMIWDLSENLFRLTGLAILFPLYEKFLDKGRYQQFLNS